MADDEQPIGMERAMKYDLLLTGGGVLDPAGGLPGLMVKARGAQRCSTSAAAFLRAGIDRGFC